MSRYICFVLQYFISFNIIFLFSQRIKWVFAKIIVENFKFQRCSVNQDEEYLKPSIDAASSQPSDLIQSIEVHKLAVATEVGDLSDTDSDDTTSLKSPSSVLPENHFDGKWTSGAGPRIRCVRDYPADLQFKALEHVNLSPRLGMSPISAVKNPIPSPRPSPGIRLSRKFTCITVPPPNVSLTLPDFKRTWFYFIFSNHNLNKIQKIRGQN